MVFLDKGRITYFIFDYVLRSFKKYRYINIFAKCIFIFVENRLTLKDIYVYRFFVMSILLRLV